MNSNKAHTHKQTNYHSEASLYRHHRAERFFFQNLILKIYRGCFERIWVVSPTAHIDEAYKSVIRYIENELKIDNKTKQSLFDEYDGDALQ